MNKENENLRTDVDISLIDVDSAIYDYIDEHIAFDFSDSKNNKVTVNMDYKNQERYRNTFKAKQKKDKTEDLYKLPAILLSRDNIRIIKNERPHWAPQEVLLHHLTKTAVPTINKKGQYEYTYGRMPVKIESTYNVDILSSYKQHNDHLIEQYVLHENKFWTSEWYAFRVSYEDFRDGSTPPQNNQERIIRNTTTMTVEGYILPKRNATQTLSTSVIQGVSDVVVSENVMTLDQFKKKYNIR